MTTASIKKRITAKGRGAIFSPADFLDLGSRASVDQALSRLADQGFIRRLTRGLYDYPKVSPRLGMLAPSVDDVARALAKKDKHVLQVSPAAAANQFGLSTQVPSMHVYLTDGPTRTRQIGKQTIQFRKASAKTLVGAGKKSGAVLQALRYVGRDGVDSTVIDRLARSLTDDDRAQLRNQSKYVPAWMHPFIDQLAA